VVLVPALGGLLIGIMARYGSKAIRGHGIPEAMEQILQNRSRIAPCVTILKPVSAAISIGTGGPFGAEGPIIATGGALGSMVGQLFSTTANERKTLLAAGAAAGMTAIFGTPVAAVLLAVELLLFEFNPRSLVPVAIACATAAAVRVPFFGSAPAFSMAEVHVASPGALLAFVFLGGLTGLVATGVSRAVYWVEDQFERLPIHWMWWPALGGMAVGMIGWFQPRTLGVGYDNIEEILSNRLPLQMVAILCVAKFVAWVISLGSGTSGGTLAPLLTIGGGLGALLAALLQSWFPTAGIDIGTGALVGMAAMFSGASRALLASVVFAFETTRQPDVLPALLAGATGAFLVSHLIMRDTIMTGKIVRRGVRVPLGFEADVLRHTNVAQVMVTTLQTLPEGMRVGELARLISINAPEVSNHQASLIVTPAGKLAGIITRGDLLRALEARMTDATILEAGTISPVVVFPDESVHDALAKLLHHEIGRLPVVDPLDPQTLIGYVGRRQILAARSVTTHEEAIREPGWLAAARNAWT
jgi:H+/Cl- antiporter ClcA